MLTKANGRISVIIMYNRSRYVALEVPTVHLGAYTANFTSNFRSVGNSTSYHVI